MIKRITSLSFFLTISYIISFAQEPLQLNLQTLLDMAKVDNPTLQMVQVQQEKVGAELKLAKQWWIPDLMIGANLHQLWGNAMNGDGGIFTDVNRQSFGGSLGINTQFDFQEGIKKQKLKAYELRSSAFQGQIERNTYVLELIAAYYRLLGTQQERIAYQNLITQSDGIITQLEVLVNEGLQYNTDLLLAKTNRENQNYRYLNASMKSEALVTTLLTLLYKDPGTPIELTDSLLLPITLVEDTELTNLKLQSTPQFQYLSNEQAAKNYEYKQVKNGLFLPQIQLNTYTGIFGDVFSDIAPTSAINGGIGWEIPLSRLSGAELKIINTEKQLLDLEMDQLSLAMKNKVNQINKQLTIILEQINSTERAIQSSAGALQETIQRQELGLARAFEIEQAQAAYLQSRIFYLQAVASYNELQYRLFVALGNNL